MSRIKWNSLNQYLSELRNEVMLVEFHSIESLCEFLSVLSNKLMHMGEDRMQNFSAQFNEMTHNVNFQPLMLIFPYAF